MDNILLRKNINEETVSHCYFFYGEECYLAYQFLNELKEALTSLEDQEFNVERLNLAIECGNLGIWDQNFKTGEVYRNKHWAEMLGYSINEIDKGNADSCPNFLFFSGITL